MVSTSIDIPEQPDKLYSERERGRLQAEGRRTDDRGEQSGRETGEQFRLRGSLLVFVPRQRSLGDLGPIVTRGNPL